MWSSSQYEAVLKVRARRLARRLIDRANRQFDLALPYPVLHFDLRGAAAGQAHGDCNLIRLNPLLLRENGEAFLAQTVPHEVAHLVAEAAFGHGIRPHGPEWRDVMALFGAAPERCHRFDISRAAVHRQRRFPYGCGCERLHWLSTTRHNRIYQGSMRYFCKSCGDALAPAPGMPPRR